MSSDILSKAFTTTRPLELEYRKISLFREPVLVFESFTRNDETDNPPIAIESAIPADFFGR